MAKLVVFTDLDGTLLHPATYSFEEALPALKLLKEKEIPLVICSSKTREEIELYRRMLGNIDPFISENGAAVFIPGGYFPFKIEGKGMEGYRVIVLGRTYREIRKVFLKIAKRCGVEARGFGDMSVKEVASLAGLTLKEAELAKKREFDEPFAFEEGAKDSGVFLKAIEDSGLHWTKGRFYHILGDNDKGKAVNILKGLYRRVYGRIKTIGLGDSLNDLPLLKEVDIPVLLPKEDMSFEKGIGLEDLLKAEGVGPAGWNKAIFKLAGK